MTQLIDALTTNQTVGAVVVALGGAALGLWLAAVWWSFADLARRAEPKLVRLMAPLWILAATPALLPLSLATYLLVRPQSTVAERRFRAILEAIVPSLADSTCPDCGSSVDPAWRRCPSCAAWLSAPCSRCGRWSAIELEVCPFCASDWAHPDETPGALPGPMPVMVSPVADAPTVSSLVFSPASAAARVAPLGVAMSRAAHAGPRTRNREARAERRTDRATSGSGPGLAGPGR